MSWKKTVGGFSRLAVPHENGCGPDIYKTIMITLNPPISQQQICRAGPGPHVWVAFSLGEAYGGHHRIKSVAHSNINVAAGQGEGRQFMGKGHN
ncbi:hypothetical protein C4J81_07430 [Deltaproteobacteria bacterium Smac51]|nr:hypothetical protein C4J81_07430 [Deltaproteobacteria bacterium Smac51]